MLNLRLASLCRLAWAQLSRSGSRTSICPFCIEAVASTRSTLLSTFVVNTPSHRTYTAASSIAGLLNRKPTTPICAISVSCSPPGRTATKLTALFLACW